MSEFGGTPEGDSNFNASENNSEYPEGGSERYEVNKEEVELKWEKITPKKKRVLGEKEVERGKSSEAILFLPGVALEANSNAVLESAQDFANVSQVNAYSISTRVENAETPNSQTLQAEAILQFISEKGLSEITLVGNSQGANKAIELAYLIQATKPDVKVKGLILSAPAGVIKQDSGELVKNFFKDAILKTAPEFGKKPSLSKAKAYTRIGLDVTRGMLKEVANSGRDSIKRMKRESKEAAQVNPHAKEIKAPVVVITSENDMAFKADRFIPPFALDQSSWSQAEREKAMREIFANSEMIKTLYAKKDSVHGMHYIRSQDVANAGWHMLERIWRKREEREQ